MSKYLIMGENLRQSMYCYDYILMLFPSKIEWCNKPKREIHIGDHILVFTSESEYFRDAIQGKHDFMVISARYVMEKLDEYRNNAEIGGVSRENNFI